MLPPLHLPPLPSTRSPPFLLRSSFPAALAATAAPESPGEEADAAGDSGGLRLAPPRGLARPHDLRICDFRYWIHPHALGSWDRDALLLPRDFVERDGFLDGVVLPAPKGDFWLGFHAPFDANLVSCINLIK